MMGGLLLISASNENQRNNPGSIALTFNEKSGVAKTMQNYGLLGFVPVIFRLNTRMVKKRECR
jgi:hypothetical protein